MKSREDNIMICKPAFRYAIPPSRLGKRHETLGSFNRQMRKQNVNRADAPKEFSLVVVLSRDARLQDNNEQTSNKSDISVLLGRKLRGFGEGFYNCFGGKLEKSHDEHLRPSKGAVRELREETGISVGLSTMEDGFVGVINFTFEDADVNRAMKVHLYCVFVSLSEDATSNDAAAAAPHTQSDGGNGKMELSKQQYACDVGTAVHPNQIRGCDEIEPKWFHNIYDIPFDQMFADDSLWLTMLLKHYNAAAAISNGDPPPKLTFDAWFHFRSGGTATNSVMHHFLQITGNPANAASPSRPPAERMTLERKLFHALHVNHIHSPSIKEFKENWAMANAVRTFLKDGSRMEVVLDVAGGHGALGALFLTLVPECREAVVIDPAECDSGKRGVREAWGGFWSNDDNDYGAGNGAASARKELRYRHECLRTGLRDELDKLQTTKNTNVTVVACHACQHLTDETLQIAAEYGANVAVMPCCQKDHDGWWKGLAKSLGLSIGALMDVLAAGKMQGWDTGRGAGVRYRVKTKLMKESISQQNRIIMCRACERGADDAGDGDGDAKKELAHAKLTRAYHRAHRLPNEKRAKASLKQSQLVSDAYPAATSWSIPSLLAGFCVGAVFSFMTTCQLGRR